MRLRKMLGMIGMIAVMLCASVEMVPAATDNETLDDGEYEVQAAYSVNFPEEYDMVYGLAQTEPKAAEGAKYQIAEKATGPLDIPRAYHNTLKEVKKLYPGTRRQDPYGACWAFGTMAMVEFSMINHGQAKKNVDMSELQIAYFSYKNITDPLGGTKGDQCRAVENGDGILNVGGNFDVSTRTMFTGVGATTEKKIPYYWSHKVNYGSLKKKYAFMANGAQIKSAAIYNVNAGKGPIDAAKKVLMENGALGITYNATNGYTNKVFYQGCEVETYSSGGTRVNHAIAIVGWDDAFDANNFVLKPAKNGAWLCRNSWTTNTEYSYDSYFYLSYYDSSLSNEGWSIEVMEPGTYKRNYQNDAGYFTEGIEKVNGKKIKRMASMFKAKKNETLQAVSLCSRYARTTYTVWVYTNLKSKKDPTSGKCVLKQKFKTTTPGQFTFELKKKIKLKKGRTFAIVVSSLAGVYDIEFDYNSEKKYYGYCLDVTASGNSFVYAGKWINTKKLTGPASEYHNKDKYMYGDVSIKALCK